MTASANYRSIFRHLPVTVTVVVLACPVSRVAALTPRHPPLDLGEVVLRVHEDDEQRCAQGQVLFETLLPEPRADTEDEPSAADVVDRPGPCPRAGPG